MVVTPKTAVTIIREKMSKWKKIAGGCSSGVASDLESYNEKTDCPVPKVSCVCKDIPKPPIVDGEDSGVRMRCTNDKCPLVKFFLHDACFEQLEQNLLKILSSRGSARGWTASQLRCNLWERKGLTLIKNEIPCRCGKGLMSRDVEFYKKHELELAKKCPQSQVDNRQRKKKKNKLPLLNFNSNVPVAAELLQNGFSAGINRRMSYGQSSHSNHRLLAALPLMLYNIAFLNRLSRSLCEAVNEQERREAEETLSKLIDSTDCLGNCLLLLQDGEQPFAQVVATGALKRMLNRKISLSIQDRLQLRNYLLDYLIARPTLPPFILNPLCKLFSLLTKVGWLEKDPQTNSLPFQLPVRELFKLARGSSDAGLLALKLLGSLVEEANSDEGLDSISKQRKISGDFRDNFLMDIFIVSLDIVEGVVGKQQQLGEGVHLNCVSQAVDLTLASVSFDFVGSMFDETLDENVNIQIPAKWRPVLLDRSVVKLMFDLYFVLPRDHVAKVFQTLVQLSSVRRMLFDSSDRQKYLEQIVTGLKRVLEAPENLNTPDNFHQYCRIVSRMKANYQVAELAKCESFSGLLNSLTKFTLDCLSMSHFFTTSSIYYLISFWSKLAGSLSYARVDVELISACIPKVCTAFIQSRIALCESVVRHGAEDPLDDMGSVKQLMELFTVLSRKDYKQTVKELLERFDESLSILFTQGIPEQEQIIARKRLIWLITMMGAGVNGKASANSSELDDDLYDGEVAARVWKTMQLTNRRLERQHPGVMDIQLEFAYIYLMDEFRKAYISDQVMRESQVYEKLGELGVTDDSEVLRLFAQKIIVNLTYWGKDEKILSSTLSLLNDLTVGYANVRRLLKTKEIQELLRNHAAFDFVVSNEHISIMKSRTNFYASLMRLLNIELEDDPSVFNQFMSPISEKFKGILTLFQSNSITSSNEGQLKMAVVGFVRDLRGIALACTKKSNYQLFLNWAMPNVFAVMIESVKRWTDNADVCTPILKLVAEMTMNRQSRLTYDMHSCITVVLFRHVSTVLSEYGNRFLQLSAVSKDLHYRQRVKNIGVVCQILRHVLSGNYLPHGVFWLYGDNCLNNALDIAFKLFFRLQEENFLAYSKVAQCVYYWVDIVTQGSMAYVSKLDEQIFIAILRAVHKGLLSVDTTICSTACTILDQILDYVFDRISRPLVQEILPSCKEPEGEKWRDAIDRHPEILYDLLNTIFAQLLFEEVKCQWSMSRPLLGLIILTASSGRYEQCKNEFICQQPTQLQQPLEQAFSRLMDGVREDNVSLKNKDNFTQNLSSFRKEVEAILRGNPVSSSANNGSSEQEFDNMTD
uniref:Importin N-terminal domain-containing protein n=1 Tax=Globodera pallida TaxID=36090 RepID=A0A183BLN1_GLOPA